MEDGRWSAGPLARYLTAAMLVRSMDSGSTVGITLLALTLPGLEQPLQVAGLLAASRTLPYLLAPITGRWLNRLVDPRPAITAGALLFATGVAATVSTLGHVPLPLTMAAAATAGLAGPLLTGGLSSILGSVADRAGRRRSGFDAITYGLGTTLSPAAVSLVAATAGPRVAVLALVITGAVASLLVLTLPLGAGHRAARSIGFADIAGAVVRIPGLRRTTLIGFGATIAVTSAMLLGIARVEAQSPIAAGWVAVAMGAGAMTGNVMFSIRPPRISSDDGMTLSLVAIVPVLAVVALASGVAAQVGLFALYGLAMTPINVMSITARGEYAPPEVQGGIFVTLAGLKLAFGAIGSALAGTLASFGYTTALLCLSAYVALLLGLVVVDRVVTGRRVTPAAP